MRIIAIIKSNCKKNSQPEKHVDRNLVARQLCCWVPQRRQDLAALMKCVCKVLIYHPSNFIMISAFHHDLALLQQAMNAVGSAPQKSENINTQEWLILPPFVVGGLVIIHSINGNWRIRVIKPFQCLYSSKFFLPQNQPPPRLRS